MAAPPSPMPRDSDLDAARDPQAIGLIDAGERLDYASIDRRAACIARRLVDEGLRPGHPLAVHTAQARRVYWATQVAWRAGCPLLPLPPEAAPETLADLLAQSGTGQVLADPRRARDLPRRVSRLSPEWLDGPLEGAPLAPLPMPPPVRLIVATSGSGGRARGVMLKGRALASAARAANQRLGLGPGDVWLACLPLQHIAGLSIPLRCRLAGAATLLHEGFNACRVWEDLHRQAVTHLSLVPAMLAWLLERGGRPPATLRTVLVGGGPLSGALAEEALARGWPLCVSYGMSETASQVCTRVGLDAGWHEGDVGLPLAGVEVEIVDDAGRPGPHSGRIRVAGPTLMSGYANPRGELGVGLSQGQLLTNDLGQFDAEGNLHVLGRADAVLVSGGVNVHPEPLEQALLACPGVREAGVVGRPDPIWGQRLVALVVGEGPIEAWAAWSREHLPSATRPRAFVHVDALPRGTLGKLDRARLRALAEGLAPGAARSSQGPAEDR